MWCAGGVCAEGDVLFMPVLIGVGLQSSSNANLLFNKAVSGQTKFPLLQAF
jgi:hypothetical protein